MMPWLTLLKWSSAILALNLGNYKIVLALDLHAEVKVAS